MSSSTCPNCGAPKSGPKPEGMITWTYVCRGPSDGDDRSHACDYATGLLKRAKHAEAHVRSLLSAIDEGAGCDCWRCEQAVRESDPTFRCRWAIRFELATESARRALKAWDEVVHKCEQGFVGCDGNHANHAHEPDWKALEAEKLRVKEVDPESLSPDVIEQVRKSREAFDAGEYKTYDSVDEMFEDIEVSDE